MNRRKFLSGAAAVGGAGWLATTPRRTAAAPRGSDTGREVPDTLDLADRAAVAINGLTGPLDPERNYEIYFVVHFYSNPPVMRHDATGFPTNNPKFLESLPRMRAMCGRRTNLEIEQGLVRGFLQQIGSDGLYYATYIVNGKPRPWNGTTEDFANVYGNARALLAMMAWYDYDGDRAWTGRIERMADRLCDIAIPAGDYSYYPDSRVGEMFSYPRRSGWRTTEELKDDSRRSNVMMYHGGVIRALARWYEMSGNRKALDVAGRLARYLRKPELWKAEAPFQMVSDYENGKFSGQFHGPTSTLWGLLQYAITVNDPELKEFARRGYEYARTFGVARIGYFPESTNRDVCETCDVADMIALAIKLSDAGVGDYWDDVDDYVRNTLVEHQLLRADYLRAVSERGPHQEVDPPRETSDHVIERNLGAFVGYPNPGSPAVLGKTWIMHCCTGNGTQALYYAWEGTLRRQGGLTTVNLFLNRSSPWMDIDSYLPYEGRVVLKSKAAQDVALRIPRWVDRGKLQTGLDNHHVAGEWAGNYVVFRGLRAGQALDVRFPLRQVGETHSWFGEDKKYTFTFKGSTVVDVNPRDEGIVGYPIYQRAEYLKNRAPLKRVQRFVPPKSIRW